MGEKGRGCKITLDNIPICAIFTAIVELTNPSIVDKTDKGWDYPTEGGYILR